MQLYRFHLVSFFSTAQRVRARGSRTSNRQDTFSAASFSVVVVRAAYSSMMKISRADTDTDSRVDEIAASTVSNAETFLKQQHFHCFAFDHVVPPEEVSSRLYSQE